MTCLQLPRAVEGGALGGYVRAQLEDLLPSQHPPHPGPTSMAVIQPDWTCAGHEVSLPPGPPKAGAVDL